MFYSIIIPVYNTKKYLERCIHSVLTQNFKDYEIILIDDGSIDGSEIICDNFAEKYHYIRAYHKKNGGLSSARNMGIKHAEGDYLVFLDSDDIIEKDSLERINEYLRSNNCDVIQVNSKQIMFSDDEILRDSPNNIYEKKVTSGEKYLEYMLASKLYEAPACFYIYKRKFLLESDLLFTENLIHEDEEFVPRMLYKAQTVSYFNHLHYIYINREESICNGSSNEIRGLNYMKVSNLLLKYFRNIENSKLKKLIFDKIVSIYLYGCFVSKILDIPEEFQISSFKLFLFSHKLEIRVQALIFMVNKRMYYFLKNKYFSYIYK